MSVSLINANALSIPLADKSVQMVVTSPPYWGLRDYNVPGQLGLEPTPAEYVAHMVRVFREVKRVLRDDGTVWLNLGDSYGTGATAVRTQGSRGIGANTQGAQDAVGRCGGMAKQLIGIPWRVAFALQEDGWYLRSDIIWAKPNPMPESVTDRPTKAHEYVFLLTKSARYFYDTDAVKEDTISPERAREKGNGESAVDTKMRGFGSHCGTFPGGRNRRTVWTVATEPTPFAHFATFPRALVEPCIKAGTSERGCCPICGAPWERVTEREGTYQTRKDAAGFAVGGDIHRGHNGTHVPGVSHDLVSRSTTTGFRPNCTHDADPRPCIVLDPFAGSGTTGIVARQLGRNFVGLDLSFTYLSTIARKRLSLDALDAWTDGVKVNDNGYHDLPLWEAQP